MVSTSVSRKVVLISVSPKMVFTSVSLKVALTSVFQSSFHKCLSHNASQKCVFSRGFSQVFSCKWQRQASPIPNKHVCSNMNAPFKVGLQFASQQSWKWILSPTLYSANLNRNQPYTQMHHKVHGETPRTFFESCHLLLQLLAKRAKCSPCSCQILWYAQGCTQSQNCNPSRRDSWTITLHLKSSFLHFNFHYVFGWLSGHFISQISGLQACPSPWELFSLLQSFHWLSGFVGPRRSSMLFHSPGPILNGQATPSTAGKKYILFFGCKHTRWYSKGGPPQDKLCEMLSFFAIWENCVWKTMLPNMSTCSFTLFSQSDRKNSRSLKVQLPKCLLPSLQAATLKLQIPKYSQSIALTMTPQH